MKTSRILLLLALLTLGWTAARADETVTVSSTNADIAENLDLKAVATLFGEVSNLEEFEKELNSEERHLNNLDLNGDGVVDYLRVVEIGEGDNRLIILQAVLAKDIYQDVASIYVEKTTDTTVSVQVVGDEYLYGTNYVIEPVYIYRPVIYDWFWGPGWICWHSPYYWEFYPRWYTYHTPWYWTDYYYHVRAFHHHHPYCSFHFAPAPRHGFDQMRHSDRGRHLARHDWATAHPENHFTQRASTRGIQANNIRQMSARPADVARATANRPANAPTPNATPRAATSTTRTPATTASRTPANNRTFGSANLRTPDHNNANNIRTTNIDNRTANSNTHITRTPATSNTATRPAATTDRTTRTNTATQRPATTNTNRWQSAGMPNTTRTISTPATRTSTPTTTRTSTPTATRTSTPITSRTATRSTSSAPASRPAASSGSMRTSSSSGGGARTIRR